MEIMRWHYMSNKVMVVENVWMIVRDNLAEFVSRWGGRHNAAPSCSKMLAKQVGK